MFIRQNIRGYIINVEVYGVVGIFEPIFPHSYLKIQSYPNLNWGGFFISASLYLP